MPAMNPKRSGAEKAADIIRDAGGQVVGKTRLQKMAYLLEIAGLGSGFDFEYRHYGPYSVELASEVTNAQLLNLLSQEDHLTYWGGTYSIFKTAPSSKISEPDFRRSKILEIAVKADPIALELAATAAYLAKEGSKDPWAETQRRKPDKAEKSLAPAQALYKQLRTIQTPVPLPQI
jgi:uncharacterized protein